MSKQKADGKVLGKTFAVLGLIIGVVGVIWHGVLGQPSLMELLYPGFSFAEPLSALSIVLAWLVGGYIFGRLLAAVYNWASK